MYGDPDEREEETWKPAQNACTAHRSYLNLRPTCVPT